MVSILVHGVPRKVFVFTDGAICPRRRLSGLAAIVRQENGHIDHWWQRQAGGMTCNEAEYAAAALALEMLLRHNAPELDLFSDSQILVEQMSGRFAARSPALRLAQSHLRGLAAEFRQVRFHHIPREQNRLADALANEALIGLPTQALVFDRLTRG